LAQRERKAGRLAQQPAAAPSAPKVPDFGAATAAAVATIRVPLSERSAQHNQAPPARKALSARDAREHAAGAGAARSSAGNGATATARESTGGGRGYGYAAAHTKENAGYAHPSPRKEGGLGLGLGLGLLTLTLTLSLTLSLTLTQPGGRRLRGLSAQAVALEPRRLQL